MSYTETGPSQDSRDYERRGREGSRSERKRQGRFYTDPALARPLVERTLAPLLGGEPQSILDLRICDPAAGAGVFLLEALRYLEGPLQSAMHERDWLDAQGNNSAGAPDWFRQQLSASPDAGTCLRRLIVERCLHAVDADSRAVALTRKELEHAVDPDGPLKLKSLIRRGDAILGIQEGELPTSLGVQSFRWRQDYAEVFAKGGFDAILGNPPWDILKPDSREFFSQYERDYRSYTKLEALACQRRLFVTDPSIETAWTAHQERHLSLTQMLRGQSSALRHIGKGDLNSYKLFLELSLHLLRPGGRLGMLVPAGLYSDLGSLPLRRFMLEENRWELLYGFENRSRMFAIDGRFKFAAVLIEKGGRTEQIQTAFMRSSPKDWAEARGTNSLSKELITTLSPESLAIPEIQTARDRDLLAKIYAHSIPFSAIGGSSWQIEYRREFDLTLDAERFRPRDELEALGYRPDACGRWSDASGSLALPLIEGRMVAAYRDHQKQWISGRGRRAVWREQDARQTDPGPQYLMELAELERAGIDRDQLKIAIMSIGSATNRRSMFATSILGMPCGNSAPTLRCPAPLHLPLLAVLNSFVYDFALRSRLGGNNLNYFILRETALPRAAQLLAIPDLPELVAQLSWPLPRFAAAWRNLPASSPHYRLEATERRQARARLDALVAQAYGLDVQDLAWILRDCDHPEAQLSNRGFTRTLDQKGFWRVDRELPAADRLSQLALAEFSKVQG